MFKPNYSPELAEIMNENDGSIDEIPHLIELNQAQFADNYKRRQDEFEKSKNRGVKERQEIARRSKKTKNTSVFSSIANELRDIYEEAKKDLE